MMLNGGGNDDFRVPDRVPQKIGQASFGKSLWMDRRVPVKVAPHAPARGIRERRWYRNAILTGLNDVTLASNVAIFSTFCDHPCPWTGGSGP